MQQRSRELYRWWIHKVYRSKGTGTGNPIPPSPGIMATTPTTTGIGLDEALIPFRYHSKYLCFFLEMSRQSSPVHNYSK
jgi:hypothetical protein